MADPLDPFRAAAGLGPDDEPAPAPPDPMDVEEVTERMVTAASLAAAAELEELDAEVDRNLEVDPLDADPFPEPIEEPPVPGESIAERDARIARNRAAKAAAPGAAVRVVDPETGKVRYDWPTVKRRYVEGIYDNQNKVHEWPSLEQVGAYFGINPRRVREISAQEGWVAARNTWQARVEETRQQARAVALSKAGVQLDDKTLDAAQLGLQLCYAKLGEIAERAKARRAATQGTGDGAQTGIDALEMSRLATAVELWHKVGGRALGDPDTTRIELTGAGGRPIEIAAELKRDDPHRITTVLAVLEQAGIGDLFGGRAPDAPRALGAPGSGDGGGSSG